MRVFLIFLMCLVLAGCAGQHPTYAEDIGHVPTGPERWKAKNQGTYTYEIVPWCSECEASYAQKKVKVYVENNVVVKAIYFSLGYEGIEVERLDYYETIDQLLADIQRALVRTPDYVEISYEAQYGYPEKYYVDFSREISDDEFGYKISNFESGK